MTKPIDDRPLERAGRKPAGGARRTLRLPEDAWEHLRAIAAREGLDRGGVPSEPRAILWLVERDRHAGEAPPG